MRFTSGTVTATPLTLGSRVFTTTTTTGHVVALNALDGAVELDVDLSGSGEQLAAPVLNGGLLYVASDHGRIWRINPDTNFVVPFDVDLTTSPNAQPVTNGGTLFFEHTESARPDRRAIAAFSLFTDTLLWTTELPDELQPGLQLLHADGTLVIASRPGQPPAITGINPLDGTQRWVDTDTTNPSGAKLALTSETPLRFTDQMLIAQIGIGAAGIDAHTGEQRWYVDYRPPPLSASSSNEPARTTRASTSTARSRPTLSPRSAYVWTATGQNPTPPAQTQ